MNSAVPRFSTVLTAPYALQRRDPRRTDSRVPSDASRGVIQPVAKALFFTRGRLSRESVCWTLPFTSSRCCPR
jgi:hypothetical protein